MKIVVGECELGLGVPGSGLVLNIRGGCLRKQQWRNKAEEKQLEGRKLRSPEAGDLCPDIHNHLVFLMSAQGKSGRVGMYREDNRSNES
jgi:hypothetical protein